MLKMAESRLSQKNQFQKLIETDFSERDRIKQKDQGISF